MEKLSRISVVDSPLSIYPRTLFLTLLLDESWKSHLLEG